MSYFPYDHPWYFLAFVFFVASIYGYNAPDGKEHRPRYILIAIGTGLFLTFPAIGYLIGGMA